MTRTERKPVIFFLGDVAMDEYYQVPYWPQIKDKVLIKQLPSHPGGMIANAAVVAAALGAEVHFLAALNQGQTSIALIDDLQAQGIDTQWIIWDDTLPDAKTMVFLCEDEHTVLIPTMGIQRIEIPQSTWDFVRNADYLYTNLVESRPVSCGSAGALEILREVRNAGCKIVFDMDVDPVSGADESYLSVIDILFMNENGFAKMCSHATEAKCISEIFLKGVQLLIVTAGAHGSRVYTPKQQFTIPGITVEAVDVTGAGDTFASAFIHAYHQTADPYRAALFATAAAARSVTIFGARGGAVSAEVIARFMKESGI